MKKKVALYIILIILLSVCLMFLMTRKKSNVYISQEDLRAMSYNQITEDNSDFVRFNAFFTRDLNNDGNAEKLDGTCKDVTSKDILYLDLNVLTEGYLKNGKIKIDGTNFDYSMNMVKDNVLKNHYISNNVKEIELNDVYAGTQKLIIGNVIADVGNDINKYSKSSTITLTGTHVADDGTQTEINKTCNLTVDWYGNVSSSMKTYTPDTYYYDNFSGNSISFSFSVDEDVKGLLLKDVIATAIIPELNGYAPTSVVGLDGITCTYDGRTKILTMTRSSKISENGIVTNRLSSSNYFSVTVTYPEEAFKNIKSYKTLVIPVTGKYVAYNNANSEFRNPITSNISSQNILITFEKTPIGEIFYVDAEFENKTFIRKSVDEFGYAISKQDLLNLYNNEDYKANFEYIVTWYASKGKAGKVNSFIMSETKSTDSNTYGDKFDDIAIDKYTSNKGIYFGNATTALGENGTIYVYNNDTNKLIKVFTKDELNRYTSTNPYIYSEPIKHIRVETSAPNDNTTVYCYNIKELDAKKIVNDFTKEQIKNVDKIYTYVTGSADIEGMGQYMYDQYDDAYYVYEKSDVGISLSKTQISTQESVNEKIYISTNTYQMVNIGWKNGEFIIEVPEEIINMEINDVTIDNSNVSIIGYDLYKKDGKYLIKILTENITPTSFRITIDCDIIADPRIASVDKELKLYAYNEYCNEYSYTTADIYDVDRDNNVTEQVGSSTTTLKLLSPMSLITVETVSDYNDKGEITIAPNIAEVERQTRQAKINIDVVNNYENTVDGVKIVGKIPFKGNTYVTNERDMKSEFNTTMTSEGIHISDQNEQEVKNKTVIYYSEKENPTNDITDLSNAWKTKEKVTDFGKIKSYLINISNYRIDVGKGVKFDYNINLPQNISYNALAFATHAVYYQLNTEGGRLSLETEPSKVGVRIVKKFDLAITKYKINSNITIPSVTYNLKYKEKDAEGVLQDRNRILTTNNEGKVLLENLFVEKAEYILQEIKVPNTCELNSNEIIFTINEDESVTINGDVRSYEFKAGEILLLEIEDEIKYNLQINKTRRQSTIPINNVNFLLEDENRNRFSEKTKNDGTAIIEGLSLNVEYTLTETFAPANCEINEGVYRFKLVRNSSNKIEIQTIENSLISGMPNVQDSNEILTPIVSLNVQDELKYTFDLTKQDFEGNNAGGIQFNIKGKGFSDDGTNYVTSTDGKLQIPGLYVDELYTIEENKAIGYYLDSEKDNTIQFKVSRVNGNLQVTTWNVGNGVLQSGTQTISEQDVIANLSTVLKNEKIPTYNLNIVKQNKEGKFVQGAQFKLTSLDTGIVQNITIDENGQGVFEGLYEFVEGKCITGEYTLEETYVPEGYILDTTVMKFRATRNEGGIVEIDIHSGDSIIKVDKETNKKVISSNANGTTITIINNPIFNLKKYGDNNVLLPNAKFAITDLDGNTVYGVTGEVIGEEVEISGEVTHVLTTDVNGEISANLPEGLYKIVEVEAPEGYDLPTNESDRTYCFGVGTNRPAKTSGTIDTIEWIKNVKSKRSSKFNDSVVTSDGGIIAVGSSEENIDLDGNGSVDATAIGGKDAIVVKYDNKGNIIWSKIIGGINHDELNGIAKVPTGGYIIAGYSSTSEVKFDNKLINVSNFGNEDGIIIKIDENGNYIWSQSLGGTETDIINDVAVAQNGDIAVVGSFNGSIYLDNNKTRTLTSRGGKDGFISVYTQNGTSKWAQSIGGTSEDYAKAVTPTSNGFAVGANFAGTAYVNTSGTASVASKGGVDGLVISYTSDGNYSWSKQIGSTANDAISDIIVAEISDQKNIVVAGSYAGNVDINGDGINDLATRGLYDGMIVKFTESGNYIKALSVGGTDDDTISTVYQTVDGGLLFGGWYYSSSLTASIGGVSKNVSLGGISDGFIAKLNSNDVIVSLDSIKGNSYDKVTSVLQLSGTQYVAVGSFQSNSLTALNRNVINSNSKFADAFAITYGESIVEPEIPKLQEINVVNNLASYDITTEIALNSNGQRDGGTITGDYNSKYLQANNKKFVESVKYKHNNTKDIVITPSANYFIKEITVNGEVVKVTRNEKGVSILPAGYFKDIAENKHIVVEFGNISEKLPQITVYYYLKDGDNYTKIKLAEDEIIGGMLGEKYSIPPKLDIEGYTLEKDENGDYVIPDNTSGTFSTSDVVIIYYYEKKPITLTIHHYLEGTEDKLADDEIKEYKEQEEYIATPSEEVLKDYELVYVDKDEEGTITEDTVITYYYRKKVHDITTMVIPHEEQRTDRLLNQKVSMEVFGGNITGEYTEDYKEEDNIKFVEKVKQKENSVTEITVTPDKGYNIKLIKLISTADVNKTETYDDEIGTDDNKTETVIFGADASETAEISYTQNDDGSITLDLFEMVTQNKFIQVEFEPLQGNIITHHIIRGEDTDYQTFSKSDLVGEPYQTGQIDIEHYKLVGTSNNTSGIVTKEDIDVYYYYDFENYNYSIHYFYNDVEDASKIETGLVAFGTEISECPDKVIPGYALEKTENLPLIITSNPEKNVINIYYRTEYKITTEVILHDENYKDGTVLKDTKGGEISGEDEDAYEKVLKSYQPQKDVVITPSKIEDDKGNILEEYEIVKIIIKDGKDDTNEIPIDFSNWLDENGVVTIPASEFADEVLGMQSDKHIQVEFRKKTKVIVQYLEKGTEDVLYKTEDGNDYIEIVGYEGKEFKTSIKPIQYYQSASPYITRSNESDTIISNEFIQTDGKTMADGKMYADTLVITYWYERIPSGIIVRYIEIDERDKDDGLELTFGKEIEHEIINGFVSLEQITNRKEYTDYISVDGPESDDENLVIAEKDENTISVIYLEDETIEVRYYYEKQYKVTTEVKLHTENVDGKDIGVKGGNIILGEQNSYKLVLSRGDIADKVVMTPDDGYRIKSVIIQDIETNEKTNEIVVKSEVTIPLSDVEKENHIGELPEEYLQDVQSHKHIIVEYEKIPTKVIIEYKDIDTKENIIPNIEIEGFVNDKYITEAKDIESYFITGQMPENREGIMTEEPITVTYWYKKHYYIKTSVKVTEDGTEKGGTISGEEQEVYEWVGRDETSKNKIVIKPNPGFKIKYILINNVNVDIEKFIKDDGTIELPLFDKMKENKDVVVEFERIAASVKVQYLEKGTDISVADEVIIDGHIGDNYETEKKDIQYYNFVESTKNTKGVMNKKETIVTYYYEKQLFNLKVDKWIESINLNGTKLNCQSYEERENIYKLEVNRKIVSTSSIKVTYKIRITNVGDIEGYVEKLTEIIPTGFEFYQEDNEIMWTESNGELTTSDLKNKVIAKDGYKEIDIVLRWKSGESNLGKKVNTVVLAKVGNPAGFTDVSKDDDTAKSEMLMMVSTGLLENGVVLIINAIQIVLAIGIATVVYKIRRK